MKMLWEFLCAMQAFSFRGDGEGGGSNRSSAVRMCSSSLMTCLRICPVIGSPWKKF